MTRLTSLPIFCLFNIYWTTDFKPKQQSRRVESGKRQWSGIIWTSPPRRLRSQPGLEQGRCPDCHASSLHSLTCDPSPSTNRSPRQINGLDCGWNNSTAGSWKQNRLGSIRKPERETAFPQWWKAGTGFRTCHSWIYYYITIYVTEFTLRDLCKCPMCFLT